jgi:hypothetical protein
MFQQCFIGFTSRQTILSERARGKSLECDHSLICVRSGAERSRCAQIADGFFNPNLSPAISRQPDLRKEISLTLFTENQTLDCVRIARRLCDGRVQYHRSTCRPHCESSGRCCRHSLDAVNAGAKRRLPCRKLEGNVDPTLLGACACTFTTATPRKYRKSQSLYKFCFS